MSRVSLIVPVYNCADFIEEMIVSCLNQTYKDIEFLFYDDGSNDNSFKVLEYYSEKDQRIKFWRGSDNKGIVFSLNFLLKMSSGTFIARADADDVLMPDRIERQIQYIESTNYDLISCSCISVNENGDLLREVSLASGPQKLKILAKFKNPVFHTWLCKKDLYNKVGFYRFSGVEDFDFITRVLDCGFLIDNIPNYFGMKIRIRNGNTQTTRGCTQRLLFNYVLRIRKAKSNIEFDEAPPLSVTSPNVYLQKTYNLGIHYINKSNSSNFVFLRILYKITASVLSPLHFQFYLRELICVMIKRFI
jgi:glycosyltransferase involved in cell wall biosynthesis